MSETDARRPIEANNVEFSKKERLIMYCEQTLEELLPDAEHQLAAMQLLGMYPEEAYHQPAHGLDVMWSPSG